MSTVRSFPTSQPHRIMTSSARAQTEPAPNGFMRSVMRQHDMENVDEGVVMSGQQPQKKLTQEEQDAEDEKARKRAMKNLVNSWQERLQLISVITTFFASTEAAMLVNTKPSTVDFNNNALKASNAALLGALILHVYAAVLSFLGAFLLIRYKLKEATREEMLAEGIKMATSPLWGSIIKDIEHDPGSSGLPQAQSTIPESINAGPERNRMGSYPLEPPIISTHPHIEQVGPFMSSVSSHLLSRTHALCVFLAAVGFVLAIAGILCYSWASQPREVSIFASTCLGGAILAMFILVI